MAERPRDGEFVGWWFNCPNLGCDHPHHKSNFVSFGYDGTEQQKKPTKCGFCGTPFEVVRVTVGMICLLVATERSSLPLTWEDIDALRSMVIDSNSLYGGYVMHWSTKPSPKASIAKAAIDRLAALMPPREEPTDG